MQDFIFEVSTKILFGKDQLDKLGKEVKKYGTKVLLVYGGGSVKRTGLYDKIVDILNRDEIEYIDMPGIEPNPRIDSVRKGVKLVKENNIDFVLAVGGGSVIDASKLIAAAAKTESDPWDIVIGKEKVKSALPIGSILTIAATGSEMDNGSVITNIETKQKLGWGSPHVLPKFAIMNPEFTFTVPKYHTAAGTADIMSHTMENYFSVDESAYLQDRFAEGILKTLIKYGPVAYNDPENYEARANIMWANSWAINGLLDSGKSHGWSVHAMEHELSALYDITHGVGLAILTPKWLEFCLNENTEKRIAEFGYNVFGIQKTDSTRLDAENAIDELYFFFKDEMHIPMSLKEVGIDESHLREMADACIKNKGNKNINGFVELSADDIYEIYRACL